MNCSIHFYLLNRDFSQEYADEHNDGNESELNKRYEWEDELEINVPVNEVITHESSIYPLQGELSNGEEFRFDIKDMFLVELMTSHDSGKVIIGCSNSLLDKYSIEEEDELKIRVYLKDYEPLSNPIPGLYIAAKDFPKELIEEC